SLAGDEAVPGICVIRFEHDAALALRAGDLLGRRLLGCTALANISVPRSRVFEFVPRMKNLADLNRCVARPPKMLGQHSGVLQESAWRCDVVHNPGRIGPFTA